jgi:endonuclease-8
MPEGHTIHRVARDHRHRFAGQPLEVTSPQGRFRAGATKLDGLVLEKVEAYGKHLFYWWEASQILHVHLGLYGKFRNHRCPPPQPRGAVRLRVVGRSHAFDLNGPTACEIITVKKLISLTATRRTA